MKAVIIDSQTSHLTEPNSSVPSPLTMLKNVNAKVDFQDFGMSLFTNFPNFSFHLDEISIVGEGEFSGDTLAGIESVSAVIDIMSVLGGDVYQVKKVSIVRPDVYLKVLADGEANYNIVPEGEEDASVSDDGSASAFNDSNMDGTMASRAIKGLYRAGKKAAMIATGGPAGGFMAKAEGIKNRRDDTNDYNNSHYIKFKGDNPDLFKSGGGTEDSVKVDPKKTTKSYVKKGGKATGSMKDYKVGSQKRRDEYTARGWKQDKTTAVKGGAKRKKVEKVSTLTSRPIVTKKVEITTKLDPTKKPKITSTPKETSKRASKLRAKGNAQLAAGDKKGALATRRKYDKKNKKVAKKTKKGTNRVEYDESTGKGGSVLGNALRSVTGKRKRDKAAAERRKNAPGGNMI